jgi:hypothetical protein
MLSRMRVAVAAFVASGCACSFGTELPDGGVVVCIDDSECPSGKDFICSR